MMSATQDWELQAKADPRLVTYQLRIKLSRAQTITVGRLGRFDFPAGLYLYTGSAKRNMVARVRRHLATEKKLRWHIDFLLGNNAATVSAVTLSADPECNCNQQVDGSVIVSGFGASDCRSRCGSHLKYLGSE